MSSIEQRKKPARGLEEVSHLFLSHHGRRASSFLFCSNTLLVEKSVLACNLAFEFARRGFSVKIIETTKKPPTIFFLLGSLLPESRDTRGAISVLEKLLSLPAMIDPPEPLQPIDIPHSYQGSIQAVFFEDDLHSAASFNMMNQLSGQADFLVVNAPANILQVKKLATFVDPFIIVPSTVHPDELLDAYVLVRQVSEGMDCNEVGHLVVGECGYERAEAASRVIANMARKFLSTHVRFMGMVPKDTDFSRSILTRTPLLLDAPDSPTSLALQRIADSLIERRGI